MPIARAAAAAVPRGRGIPALAALVVAFGAFFPNPARAIDDRADVEPNALPDPGRHVAWKLTAGRYLQPGAAAGTDLNLRGSDDDETFWIGVYHDAAGFDQGRAGYERQVAVPFGRVIGSLQVASGGFVGGSVTLEARVPGVAPLVGLVGIGRTNLRPYVNLNFDPNDSILLGAGWRIDPATQLTAYHLWDDRLGTGQRVTHLVLRRAFTGREAVSVDLFRRDGRAEPDAPRYVGTGVALTWSHRDWFVRVARDPHATFTEATTTRLALGAHF
jgi:hypothetical protein